MNTRSVDLNLLSVFEAAARTGSVTKAAHLLGLSKAATSRALGRLRAVLGDPVLVRDGSGWVLTEPARALLEQVQAVTADARRLLSPPDSFRPETSTRDFRIHATDHVVSLIGASICGAVGREAPGAGVRFLPILPDDVPALRDDVDLAMGVFPDLPATFSTQLLFEDHFVCVVRTGHPRVQGRITLNQYLELKHVLIAPRGRPGGTVDQALAQRGLSRHVTRHLPYSLAALELVSQGDCVLTMSGRLARRHASRFNLQVLKPPLPLPSYKITQVWDPRRGPDRGHAWFRQVVARVTASMRGRAPTRPRA